MRKWKLVQREMKIKKNGLKVYGPVLKRPLQHPPKQLIPLQHQQLNQNLGHLRSMSLLEKKSSKSI